MTKAIHKDTSSGRGHLRSALALVLAFVLVLFAAPAKDAAAKYASIVIDADTGEVLHETNADTRNFPASLTKMMTLYLLFEAIERGDITLAKKLTVSAHAAGQEPSKLGLKKGNKISVENVILALVVKSANDAAVVAAEALGETESGFAKLMTAKAKALGMTNTTFKNASGLPNSKQLSTAHDMAILAQALMRDFPQYYHYFSRKSFNYKGKTYETHNKLLITYPGADGLKTGYTRASGYNVALSAERDGRRLIVVVFGGQTATTRNIHAANLLDGAFGSSDSVEEAALEEETVEDPAADAAAIESIELGSAAVAPSDQVASLQPIAPVSAGWAIQVGAFSRFSPAHNTATMAQGKAPDLLARAQVFVMEVESTQGKLYRARLMGLSQGDAVEACRLLSKQDMACLVIEPGQS